MAIKHVVVVSVLYNVYFDSIGLQVNGFFTVNGEFVKCNGKQCYKGVNVK